MISTLLISEIVERNKARTTVWKTKDGLLKYIHGCIAPPVRTAIKNLFLATFKYPTIPDQHILKPSADANDMRLNLHEERISRNEIALANIDIVAEMVAREVADLKLAKAAGAFEKNATSVSTRKIEKLGEGKLTRKNEQP